MAELDLNFRGCGVKLAGDAETVAELRRDFAAFTCAEAPKPLDSIELIRAAPPSGLDTGLRLWSTPRCTVRASQGERRILYAGDAAAAFDFRARRGRIYCAESNRLRELGYLAVLSRAGEALDARGLHRAHAAGFEWEGEAGLIFMPSGGGKSELTLEFLNSTGAGLLSDDSPLIDVAGRAYSFPLRMGFLPSADLSNVPSRWVRPFERRDYAPKRVVDHDFFRDRVRDGLPARWLFVGRRAPGAARISPLSRAAGAAALGLGLVVGHGVAQMAEYRLRPSDTTGLARAALSRIRAARALLSRASLWEFSLGRDPRDAARALTRFLSKPA